MNISQLEYLIAVVRCGSVVSAGRELHITPQAISKAIHALEQQYDLALFRKEGRSLTPTNSAMDLARRAEPVLDQLDNLRAHATTLGRLSANSGTIRIGIVSLQNRGKLYPDQAFEAFREQHPLIELVVVHQTKEFCHTALDEGVLDGAIQIGRSGDGRLESLCIGQPRIGIALSPADPLTQQEEVALRDLSAHPVAYPTDMGFFYRRICDSFSERSTVPLPDFRIVDEPVAKMARFIQEGGAVFTVGESPISAAPGITERPLCAEDAALFPAYLVYRPSELPACFNHLRTFLMP